MDESKRVIDGHEIGLSWDEEGVHFRVDETDDLPVSKTVDTDTVDGKHASDLQNYNNLTNKLEIPIVAGNAKNAVRLKDGKSDYQMGEGAAALSPNTAAKGNFSFAEGSYTNAFGENKMPTPKDLEQLLLQFILQ